MTPPPSPQFLGEADLFWIANEYLSIPADAYPLGEDVADWYRVLREEWSNAANRHVSYASFQNIKRAIRSLLTKTERQPDIALWIECLRVFRDGPDARLADMSSYEIAVASERIKSSMSGLEADLRGFFERALSSCESSRLMDATCLLQYTTVANIRGTTEVTVDELKVVRLKLQEKAKELVAEAANPTQKCVALDLSAFVQLAPEPGARTPPNLVPAFRAWNKLVELVDRAPLFPLSEFSDRLVQWLPFLIDSPEYEPLMAKLDAAVARRTGRFAAAKNCAARAKRLSEEGRLIQAIRELNRAKIDWFSSETFHLALGSMILAARHYMALGLVFASKYYALAVAYLALSSDDQRVKWLIARGAVRRSRVRLHERCFLSSHCRCCAERRPARSTLSGEALENDDEDLHRLLLYGAYIYGLPAEATPDSGAGACVDQGLA